MIKKKKSSFIMKMNIWVSILTVVVAILICFTIFNLCVCVSGGVNIEKTNDATYINVIITIAGFLAAFSAISIYSVFNTNIDREKDKLEELRIDSEKTKKNLEVQINGLQVLEKELEDNFIQFKTSEKDLNEYLNLVKSINNLTSPYSIELKKREAIKYFSTIIFVADDIKGMILNFYNSLESNKEERSKKYFQELEALLRQWEMIE